MLSVVCEKWMKDEESYYVHVPWTVLLQMKLTLHDICYVRFTNQMYFMSQMKTAFPQYLFSSSKICFLNIGICCKWFTGYSMSHTGRYHLPSRSKSFNKRTKLWKWIIFDKNKSIHTKKKSVIFDLQNRKKVLPKYDSIWININNSICL